MLSRSLFGSTDTHTHALSRAVNKPVSDGCLFVALRVPSLGSTTRYNQLKSSSFVESLHTHEELPCTWKEEREDSCVPMRVSPSRHHLVILQSPKDNDFFFFFATESSSSFSFSLAVNDQICSVNSPKNVRIK